MRVLCVADEPDRGLWDWYTPSKLEGVGLILSAGDLPARYLEFLVTMANVPLLYVPGNHDGTYAASPPEGCMCVDGRVVEVCGLRIGGLGGCVRYRPGIVAHTEEEQSRRALRLQHQAALYGGLDVLLAHAPAAGCGDLDDRAHRGFACFHALCACTGARHLVHGHVHGSYLPGFEREHMLPCGTRATNAYGKAMLDMEPVEHEPPSPVPAFLLRLERAWEERRPAARR